MERIFTIGHSTRGIDEFLSLLHEHRVQTLVDVRRFPGSRRFPHFSARHLSDRLLEAGLEYLHLEKLGGRRTPIPGSPNRHWKNASFRAYADHMATAGFAEAIEQLLELSEPVAVLCSEALPWRCHRNLVADELTRRGLEVIHILGREKTESHALNAAAVDQGTYLIYPGPQRRLV